MVFNKFRRFILYFRGLFQGRIDKTKEVVKENTDTVSDFVEPEKRLEDENGAKIGLEKSDLEVEPQRSHQTIQPLRVQEDSMEEELKNLKNKLSLAEEMAEFFKSRYQEERVKNNELENKLQQVSSTGSIPIFQHERKVAALERTISVCHNQFIQMVQHSKVTAAKERILQRQNENLKSTISKMLEKDVQEKKEIREEKPTRKSPSLNDEENLPWLQGVGYKCYLTMPSEDTRELPVMPDALGEIPGKNITLRQFKSDLSDNLRYFFKAPSEDLGFEYVFEQVIEDSEVLPLWEGQLLCFIRGL